MRCDLHVHTLHSGPPDLPGLRHLSRECYSEPRAVYETAKRRGMDLVTITDHDTIEGALKLAHLPDFIVGEEVTCVLAPGREIHLGIWDLNESRHAQISLRRRDPESLFAWLAENRIPACINHPFSPLTGIRVADDFRRAFSSLDLIEAHNGMMPAATNEYARLTGRALGMSPVGGSDAHTLAQVAHAFTTVPKATNRSEFLEGLRAGLSVPAGGSGSCARLARDIFKVLIGAARENASYAVRSPRDFARFAATLPILHLVPLVPLFAVGSYLKECAGGRALHTLYQGSRGPAHSLGRARTLTPGLAMVGER